MSLIEPACGSALVIEAVGKWTSKKDSLLCQGEEAVKIVFSMVGNALIRYIFEPMFLGSALTSPSKPIYEE